jgi:hypothetical protein
MSASRPIYETPEDLKNERDIADHVSHVWKISLVKMHLKHYIDFMAFRDGKAVAVVEARRRFNLANKYPTFFISLAKWNKGIEYFKTNNLEFCLVICWDDGMQYYKYKDGDDFEIEMGGSQPWNKSWRGDAQDYEPVIHIPMGRFVRI